MATYWYRSERGVANEYTLARATGAAAASAYELSGFERVTRTEAEWRDRRKGDAATKYYIRREVDGEQTDRLF